MLFESWWKHPLTIWITIHLEAMFMSYTWSVTLDRKKKNWYLDSNMGYLGVNEHVFIEANLLVLLFKLCFTLNFEVNNSWLLHPLYSNFRKFWQICLQGVHLRVIGVGDSRSLVVASDVLTMELNDKILLETCRIKLGGGSLSDLSNFGNFSILNLVEKVKNKTSINCQCYFKL